MSGRFCLIIALALAVSGCAHKKPVVSEGVANYFATSKVHRYRLANGLKILILPDHSAPTFAYQTWYDVGSRDEELGRTGLAHFFEHLMFKATKNRKEGEFDRLLTRAGAEGTNAFTSRDFTAYIQSLPSTKLELIADLESDRMVNLLVEDGPVNSEREVVQNERRFRTENNPTGLLFEKMFDLAYTKHSYRHPVIGYDQDLRAASRQDFENFYKRFYAPNNATIVLVGDVDPEKAVETIARYYNDIPRSKIERPTPTIEPAQRKERAESMPIKSPVEKLVVGYHLPNGMSTDFPAIEAAREILAGGKGSRLYRKLVDGGIATSVDLESSEQKDPGLLMVFITLQKGKTAKQALTAIDREIKELEAGHFTDEELQRAISMHRFMVFDDLASNYSKARFIGFYEAVAGNFERGVEIVNALAKVDRASVSRAVRAYYRKDNRSVVIGTPVKGTEK